METSNTSTSSTRSGVFWGFHFPLPLSFPPPPKQAVSFPRQHSDSSSHLILMKSFPPAVINPLFSSFVTLYTLILLYFPSFFLKLLFSPVLISAGILLLSILRFGAAQKGNRNLHETTGSVTDVPVIPKSHTALPDSEHGSGPAHDPDPDPDSSCRGSFLEWDVGAPLEVIHETCCEGEDALDDAASPQNEDRRLGSELRRYPSLSRYYPETDSDSDSNSDPDSDSSSSMEGEFPVICGSDCSLERTCFRWTGEEIDEEKDGLIEIQLDDDCGKRKVLEELEFDTEEDSFIEIDISPVAAGES